MWLFTSQTLPLYIIEVLFILSPFLLYAHYDTVFIKVLLIEKRIVK